MGLQETKKTGKEIREVENYIFFNSRNEDRRLGTGFLLHKKYLSAVMDFREITEGMCLLRIRTKFRNMALLNIHTEVAESDTKESFCGQSEEEFSRIPSYDMKTLNDK